MGKWYALISQTGSELAKVTASLKVYPDVIFTTNNNSVVKSIRDTKVEYRTPQMVNEWLLENVEPGDIITLHGYLHILSPEVCALPALIVNGHPGLINKYPELKGRDPQEKVLAHFNDYDEVGCVLHKVTPEVDSGEIITYVCIKSAPVLQNASILYATLHQLSVQLWVAYLKEVFTWSKI